MPRKLIAPLGALLSLVSALPACAGVGDPQVRSDHPWYPGELAMSTFDRLFATQAEAYRRATGIDPKTDEQKALASWFWRNTHYWHGEEGAEDLWGGGFTAGGDLRTREYWTGLFAHGFGLCGTTHSQWVAEMNALLGHNRGRGVGVTGHNSFEVFLTGGPYGAGKWALLDHDISTVIFNKEGTALLSIPEVRANLGQMINRSYLPQKQHGWLVAGLDAGDGGVYRSYETAEYLAGYSGPPPTVHLRRGETFRRYLQPGLEDGKTFVFWGRNYKTDSIPGPERSQTWVNQPEKMHGSQRGAGYRPGQARYANAVYTYRPDFATADYKEGVVKESADEVTFEFYTPYIIGATPPNDEPWGVYERGGKNGLVLTGVPSCDVSVSVDQGKTWKEFGRIAGRADLTDAVKGRRQYLLRLGAGPKALAPSGLTMTTVCQASVSTMPRLKDGGTRFTFQASGRAVISAGPNRDQARAHLVDGDFGTPKVTLQLAAPRGERAVTVYAAAHVQSGNPPAPTVKYQIEYSTDAGKSWKAMLKDWTVTRRGDEPKDFWSQSFCWGSAELSDPKASAVQVRFSNDGGKSYARCEAHLVYDTGGKDSTKLTVNWMDEVGVHQAGQVFPAGAAPATWDVPTGRTVETRWVQFEPVKLDPPKTDPAKADPAKPATDPTPMKTAPTPAKPTPARPAAPRPKTTKPVRKTR